MTRGKFFCKRTGFLFREQIWVFCLAMVGLFLVMPVWYTMAKGNGEGILQTGGLALLGTIGTILIGCVAAWKGWSRLDRRESADMVGSVPATRSELFATISVVGALDVILPVIVNTLLLWAAVWIHGDQFDTSSLVWSAVPGMICFGLEAFFLASLAMMLTGQVVIGILGTMALMLIGPVWYMLIGNYIMGNSVMLVANEVGKQVLNVEKLITLPVAFAMGDLPVHGNVCLLSLLRSVVLAVLSLIAFNKRPMEKAGHAMVFRGIGEVILGILVVTASLLVGLFFGNDVTGWHIFGLAVGFLLAYATIRMLYTHDFRKIFSGKATLVISALCVVAIVAGFKFDFPWRLIRLPERENIEKVAIVWGNARGDTNASNASDDLSEEGMECTDEAWKVLKTLSEEYDRTPNNKVNGENVEWFYARVWEKNGRSYLRSYHIADEKIMDEITALYGTEAYQKGLHGEVWEMPEGVIRMSVSDMLGESVTLKVGSTEAERLLEALRKEMCTETPEARVQEIAVNLLIMEYTGDTGSVCDAADTILIYPSMTETISILEELGLNGSATVKDVEVTSLTVSSEDGRKDYDDPEEIREILKDAIPDWAMSPWTKTEPGKIGWLYWESDKGENFWDFYFPAEE